MNIHSFVDHYTVLMGALVAGRRKFFAESTASRTLPELLESTAMQLPAAEGEGSYEVPTGSAVGPLDPAFFVAQWHGAGHPTLIYHHGNNERPFAFNPWSKNTFQDIIYAHRDLFPANLIALRAPFHQSLGLYLDKITDLENFASMLMASVRLIEALQAWSRAQGSTSILVSGVSLGGWVTNLHRAYYNSADVYLPMLAGAALDEVFLSSAYRRLTGDLALRDPEAVRRTLNFEDAYRAVESANVFPLLARHDAIIVCERQQQAYTHVTTIDKGHTTAVLAAGALRAFLLEHLPA